MSYYRIMLFIPTDRMPKITLALLLCLLTSGMSNVFAQPHQKLRQALPTEEHIDLPLCTDKEAGPKLPETIMRSDLSEPTPILQWRIIGPFVLSDQEQTYTRAMESSMLSADSLRSVGCSESPFRSPPASTSRSIDFARDSFMEEEATEESHFINQDVRFPTAAVNSQLLLWGSYHTFKVLYAAADIEMPAATDAVLLVPTNSPIAVWVNSAKTQSTPGSVGENWDNHMVIRARLKAGRNHILVKLVCFPLRNTFALWVTNQRGAESFIAKHGGIFDVVSQVIYKLGTPLTTSPVVRALWSNNSKATLTLRNLQGFPVRSVILRTILQTTGLPPGVYTAEVRSGNIVASELLFLGSARRAAERYIRMCRQHATNIVPCKSLDRLGIVLNDPQTSFVVDKQKLAVSLLANLAWYRAATPDATPGTNAPWMRAVPFRSSVDNSVQAYYLHAPSLRYKGERLPLVIVEPPATSNTPFYDNVITRHTGTLMKYARYADQFHFAVIAVHARGYQMPAGIAAADALDAMRDIEGRIQVDVSRVYIAGDCAGGRSAFFLAEQHPELFARISTLEASTGRAPDSVTRGRDRDNVLGHLTKLVGIPTQIVHGTSDYHSPSVQADILMKSAEAVHYHPVRINVPGDADFGSEDSYWLMFKFFEDKIHHVGSEQHR